MSSFKKFLVFSALACVLSASSVSAQQPAAPSQPAPQKPNYGQWWLKNAREVTPKPNEWLFHIEGTGSFANQTGSVSGFEYTTSVLTALRKNIFTNQVRASFILQEAQVEGQGNFKQTTERFLDMFYINVAGPYNVVTAVIYEKDEPKHVLHRFSVFQGVERIFMLSKGRAMSLLVAVGHEQEQVQGQFGEQSDSGVTAYAQHFASLPIGQRGVFTHFLEYFHDLETSDDYRVNWDVSLRLQVNPHLAIGPSFQIRYDAITSRKKTDTMGVIGVTFR